MKIQTLKDLKGALKDIPDEILERFGAGVNSYDGGEFVTLLCWGDDEDDSSGFYSEQSKKYPQLDDMGKWVTNVAKEQSKIGKDGDWSTEVMEREEPISSEEK